MSIQVASASRSVFPTAASVAPDVRAARRGNAPRILTSGWTRCAHSASLGALSVPRIQLRTKFWEQPDTSAVVTLWPTPGTTSNLPCGNWRSTAIALATGVRMSKPPSIAIIGTLGRGPGPSGEFPAGDGHCAQKKAVPIRAAHGPKGPRLPAGSAASAWSIAAWRPDGGVDGSHGKRPSAQFVAAFKPKLRSWEVSTFARRSRSYSRNSGRAYPVNAACTAAGASAARPGVRSASISIDIARPAATSA